LCNAKHQVVYRETYPVAFQDGGFESTVKINAIPFTTKQGSGILIQQTWIACSAPKGASIVRFSLLFLDTVARRAAQSCQCILG
jgi:hypothetical protein